MIFAQNANKKELMIAIDNCVWGSFNAKLNFANPRKVWINEDDYWNSLIGSYLFIKVSNFSEFCVFRIDSLPSDDVPNPFGSVVYGRVKVTPITSLLDLPNSSLEKSDWSGARGLTRVVQTKPKFEKWLKDTHYSSNTSVSASSGSSVPISNEDLKRLFDYPIEYWGKVQESENIFVGKQYRQSGGTNLITYLILQSFYQWKNPCNVCVLFAGDRSSHSSQWCYDLSRIMNKIGMSVRPMLFGSVREFVNSRKEAYQSGKPIIVLATYKDYTQVKDLINPLDFSNLNVINVFDEMQKVYVSRGKEYISHEKQDRGDIHRMLESVVSGKYWNTIANIFMSGTPLSAGFKDLYSDSSGSWIWKPTHAIDDNGTFTSIAQMKVNFRDDVYWESFKIGDFCEQAKLDLLRIPCFNKTYNIVPINVGTREIKQQHDLAFAIKQLREGDNQWGSYYAVFNGSDGFEVIGNTIDEPFFSLKGVSPKVAIDKFRKKVPNAKDAMLFVITDVMSSVNVSYRDLTDTSLCYAQFLHYKNTRVESNGIEDGIQLCRCEGYLKGYQPSLFITEEFYNAAVNYDKEVESFFLQKIKGSPDNIVDRSWSISQRMMNRLHHTKHKATKHKQYTAPEEALKSRLLELRPNIEFKFGASCLKIDKSSYELLIDYCTPGFAERHGVDSRSKIIGDESNSRSNQVRDIIFNAVESQNLYLSNLDKFNGSIRFIEGTPDFTKKGGGNDWSVYGKSNWAKIYQSEGKYRKDRFRKIIWWHNNGSILVRIMLLDGEVGLIHDFDGTPRAFHYDPEVTHQEFEAA